MNPLKNKIELSISDPWDRYQIINTVVVQLTTANGETLLLVEDIQSKDKYVISARHLEEDIMNVFRGETVHVAIGKPDIDDFTFDSLNFNSHLGYYGIGSIKLNTEEFE